MVQDSKGLNVPIAFVVAKHQCSSQTREQRSLPGRLIGARVKFRTWQNLRGVYDRHGGPWGPHEGLANVPYEQIFM
eukprot:6180517-Pleurochrysis_carterae.AAC.1